MSRRAAARADTETRARILAAATALFADRGYAQVTVRDICRDAGANVAAVNYHFGGKMDLYADVLASAVAILREVTEEARRVATGRPPEEQLRAYIRVHCERLFALRGASWLHQLIHRELNDPTEGLTTLLEGALKPRFALLQTIVRELLGDDADADTVQRCTASVHAQIVGFRPNAIHDRLPRAAQRAFAVEPVIEHITAFSLAALAHYRPARSGRRTRPSASRR